MSEVPVQFDPHIVRAATWMKRRDLARAIERYGCVRHEGKTCPLLILEPLILRRARGSR